jgi:hypothetical protein
MAKKKVYLSREDRELIRVDHKNGTTIEDLAKRFNVVPDTIKRHLGMKDKDGRLLDKHLIKARPVRKVKLQQPPDVKPFTLEAFKSFLDGIRAGLDSRLHKGLNKNDGKFLEGQLDTLDVISNYLNQKGVGL